MTETQSKFTKKVVWTTVCKCYYGNALKFRYQNVGI